MEWLIQLANWFGSAVCHQWDTHSYSIDGIPLPLCARCTGLYLGALVTILYLARRHPRAVRAPDAPYLFALLVLAALWAGDGVNSLFSDFTQTTLPRPPRARAIIVGSLLALALLNVLATARVLLGGALGAPI